MWTIQHIHSTVIAKDLGPVRTIAVYKVVVCTIQHIHSTFIAKDLGQMRTIAVYSIICVYHSHMHIHNTIAATAKVYQVQK